MTAISVLSGSELTANKLALVAVLLLLFFLLMLCFFFRQKKYNRRLREQLNEQEDHILELETLLQIMSQLSKSSYFVCSTGHNPIINNNAAQTPLGAYIDNLLPESRELFRSKANQLFQGEIQHFTHNNTLKIRDEIRQHLSVFRRIKLPHSNRSQAILTIMDITELERQNSELANAGKLLQAVFDNLPGHIFLKKISSDFTYERCNPSFSGLLQKNPSDIIGKTDFDLFERDLANRIRACDLGVARNHTIDDNRWFFSTPDGKEHAIRFISRPLTMADGSECILGFGVDVTRQEYIASKLRRRNKELRLLLSQMPGKAMLLDSKLALVCATARLSNAIHPSQLLPENRFCSNICRCGVSSATQCAACRVLHEGLDAQCSLLPDGEILQLKPISDETGHINYIFARFLPAPAAGPTSGKPEESDNNDGL